jgi:hypothetical protein
LQEHVEAKRALHGDRGLQVRVLIALGAHAQEPREPLQDALVLYEPIHTEPGLERRRTLLVFCEIGSVDLELRHKLLPEYSDIFCCKV